MKMYPDDWQVKLTTGLVSSACVVAAMMLVGMKGFWPFMLSIIVATIVGNLLGPLVYRLLFRLSSGGPMEKEKKDEKK
jgi:formate/nitrite transporter FocA (FNT family)